MASGSGSDVIRVLTWNINGLKTKLKEKKNEERKTKLLEIFDQYDVVLLQETKIGNMRDGKDDDKNWEIITKALSENYTLIKLKDQTRGETADNQEEEEDEEETRRRRKTMTKRQERGKTLYMTYFSSRMKGVAILVNKPHTLLSSFSEGGFYAWVHVEIEQQKYTFVSVYYHRNADDQIRNLMRKISTEGLDAFKCRPVIGGDFNTTLNPELDVITVNPEHAERRERVKEFLSAENMSDVWREKHPEESKYTYKHHTGTHSRLDYMFILEDDVEYVTSCEILNEIDLSDHSPVSLTLNYTDSFRGHIREE